MTFEHAQLDGLGKPEGMFWYFTMCIATFMPKCNHIHSQVPFGSITTSIRHVMLLFLLVRHGTDGIGFVPRDWYKIVWNF